MNTSCKHLSFAVWCIHNAFHLPNISGTFLSETRVTLNPIKATNLYVTLCVQHHVIPRLPTLIVFRLCLPFYVTMRALFQR